MTQAGPSCVVRSQARASGGDAAGGPARATAELPLHPSRAEGATQGDPTQGPWLRRPSPFLSRQPKVRALNPGEAEAEDETATELGLEPAPGGIGRIPDTKSYTRATPGSWIEAEPETEVRG